MTDEWCTIESDPGNENMLWLLGVFTGILQEVGVKGVQVEEVYGLDRDCLTTIEPIHGLIFLFKWDAKEQMTGKEDPEAPAWFAKQVIQNACATQALLSCLMNMEDSVELGECLQSFKEFTMALDPESRGQAIGGCEPLKRVHNSFGRPELQGLDAEVVRRVLEDLTDDKDREDPFHFIALLPVAGQVYEFDGLKEAPINHGDYGHDWVEKALTVIRDKVAMAPANEIRFNLMAVIGDRLSLLQEQLANCSEPAFKAELQWQLQQERDKMAEYRRENALRRHNFVPFLLRLCEVLVERNLI